MLKFFQCDKVAFCVKRVVLHYNNFQVCSPACSKKGQKQRSNVETEYIESIHTDFAIDVTKVKPYSTVIQLDQRGYSTGKGKEGKGSLWIKSIMKEIARHATGNPLIMIDGVLTDSVGYLISINPSQIKSFSVVNSRSKLRPYGALGKHGILVIETIVGKPRGLQSKSSLFIKGIDDPVPLGMPTLSQNQGRNVPYLRPSLFWDPNLALSSGRAHQSVSFRAMIPGAIRFRWLPSLRMGLWWRQINLLASGINDLRETDFRFPVLQTAERGGDMLFRT